MALNDAQKYVLNRAFIRLLEEPETLQKFIQYIKEGGLEHALRAVNLDPELAEAFRAHLRELNNGIDPRPGQWFYSWDTAD